MKESLTKHQVEFLLEYFFKNERYAGWRGIATKLIENGKCIVAGDECIWKGGIGNFVKTNETSLAEGCLEYTFDVISFVENSLWFKEIKSQLDLPLNGN